MAASSKVPDQDAALRTPQAAGFLGVSPAHLNNLRSLDKRAMRLSEPTQGPRFIILGRNVTVYKRSDLIAWMDAHVVTPDNVEQTMRKGAHKTNKLPRRKRA